MIDPNASYYAAVRHADIKAASAQPEVFSSAAGATSIPDLPPEFLEFFGSMINMDAPRHVRLRRIVSQAFTPRMMSRIETDVADVARTLVNRLADGPAADGAEFDFVAEVAAPLPLTVICNLMGVPDSEAERVFRCSNVILGAGDPEYVPEGGDLGPVLLAAGAELAELVSGLCKLRRESPTGDLVTALADAEVDGERLTDGEIASFFVLLRRRQRDHPQCPEPCAAGAHRQAGPAGLLARRLRGAGARRRRGDRALVEPGDLDAPDRARRLR
jgi:cytochrome P450